MRDYQYESTRISRKRPDERGDEEINRWKLIGVNKRVQRDL